MGMRGSPIAELIFEDARVPQANLLLNEGDGWKILMEDGNMMRVWGTGIMAVGIAQKALDHAVEYAKERIQFGQPIAHFQAIQFKLADMAMEIELARNMVLKAAWLKDNDRSFGREASMAKVFASETAKRAADQAIQIHGGEGFMETSAVARYWRQVKINEIGEGTSEINRQIIARSLLAESAEETKTKMVAQ